MIPIKNVSIPQACRQSWQQMTEVTTGRYCESCCKTVIDFTTMSDHDIIKYLSTNKSVCGKFEGGQMNSLNNYVAIQNAGNFSWKGLFAGISLISLLPVISADAAVKRPETFQNILHLNNHKAEKIQDTLNHRVIKGKIVDSGDGSPVIGATIRIKGTNRGSMADANGNFTLNIPDSTAVLTVSFIGYEAQDVLVSKYSKGEYEITLSQPVVMKTAVLGGIVLVRASLPKRIWYKIKRLF